MDCSEVILEGLFLIIGPFMGGYQLPISPSTGLNMVIGRRRTLKRLGVEKKYRAKEIAGRRKAEIWSMRGKGFWRLEFRADGRLRFPVLFP